MPFPQTVRVIVDGTPVDAANTNGPIADLTQRTDWLKAQLDNLEVGEQIILRDQNVESGLTVGTPVYLDKTDDTFKAAVVEVDTANLNVAGERTFWQGIISNVAGTVGDIVIGGAMTLTPAEWAVVFDTGTFTEGDIFLGEVTPGTVSASPGGTGIYLGHLRVTGEMLVRTGNPGAFTEHIHLERTLLGQPATTSPNDPAVNTVHTIAAPDAAEQGWLPANATYFPGFVVGVQIPTGAKFGYNINNVAETALQEIFPVLPESNAQLSQGGVVLGDDRVILNQYGIWWMDDTYGNAPWPVNYAAEYPPSTALDITLWTTRIIASASILDLVIQEVLTTLEAGAIDSLAVSGLITADNNTLTLSGTEGDAVGGWKGIVTITPNGVNAARFRRGITISNGSGNNTAGWRGLLDYEFTAELESKHQYTNITNVPLDTMAPMTTNGFVDGSGSDIGVYGHRLGPDSTDYIDFLITGGQDLLEGASYAPTIRVHCGVDTAIASPVTRNFNIEYYRFVVNNPLSSTALQRTDLVAVQDGVPGRLQAVTIAAATDVVIQRNQHLLVRIKPTTDGAPLTADTLRVLSVYYGLTEVVP